MPGGSRGPLFAIAGDPSPTNSSVFVTSGAAHPGLPSGGRLRCLIAGWLRGPSPLATIQRCSPRFRSIAVIRPYGGLKSGRPLGPPIHSRVPRVYRRFVLAGSPGRRSATNGVVIDGTYKSPVSGSNAAPCQSAPPTEPGNWIVPFVAFGPVPRMDGGVNSGPVTYPLTIASAS